MQIEEDDPTAKNQKIEEATVVPKMIVMHRNFFFQLPSVDIIVGFGEIPLSKPLSVKLEQYPSMVCYSFPLLIP